MAELPARRRALFLGAIGALTLLVAIPLWAWRDGSFRNREEIEGRARHDELARRGMFDGEESVAPVWLNAYCVVDDRPAYEDYCQAAYGRDASSHCNVKFCRFGNITTTIDGFTGPLHHIALRPKPDDVYRILALGGSTTGSMAWDAIWPGALEGMLNRKARAAGMRTRFEVLNDGIVGSSSAFSRERYESWGRRFTPDMVILGQEVNDFCRSFETTRGPDGRSQEEVVAAYLAGEAEGTELADLGPWFARHRENFRDWRDEIRADTPAARLAQARRDRSGTLGSDACRRSELDPPPDAPSIFDDYGAGARHTLEAYERVLATARADGAELVVTTAPHDFERWMCPLLPSCAPIMRGHDTYRYLTGVANPAIRDFAEREGLLLVDLERALDALEASPRGLHIDPEIFPEDRRERQRFEARFAGHVATPPGQLRDAFFAEEWMHPVVGGYHWIATHYLERLWPRLREELP